uniref:(northern house mosquito) hypothetical protein n=1 Tax=Culex pipiens TaxID=7175 RepID=A0A8D8L5E6_CULPI
MGTGWAGQQPFRWNRRDELLRTSSLACQVGIVGDLERFQPGHARLGRKLRRLPTPFKAGIPRVIATPIQRGLVNRLLSDLRVLGQKLFRVKVPIIIVLLLFLYSNQLLLDRKAFTLSSRCSRLALLDLLLQLLLLVVQDATGADRGRIRRQAQPREEAGAAFAQQSVILDARNFVLEEGFNVDDAAGADLRVVVVAET